MTFAFEIKNKKAMKKYLFLLLAVLTGASAFSSCNKMQAVPASGPNPDDLACLTVSIAGTDAEISSKASSVTEHAGDKTASSTQILIFDSAGNFIKSLAAAGSVTLSKGMVYTVAAVINGPSVSGNLSAVESTVASLAGNPYVMYGKSTANLTSASSASVTVSVISLASRVHLTSVRNNMAPAFGALTLKRVYLCNVVGGCQLDGTTASTWYNQYGRKALATKITPNSLTGAVDPESPAAESTLASFSDQAVSAGSNYAPDSFFYTFPNPVKTAIPKNVASLTTWTDQATWITVCGTVGGTVYYWTANIGAKLTAGLERNKSYDVSLTINNLGTSDPGTPVEEATATVSVTVTPWAAGSEISETI